MTVRVRFVWRDLWIGVFVEKPTIGHGIWRQRTFICIVPMLPIIIERRWRIPPAWRI